MSIKYKITLYQRNGIWHYSTQFGTSASSLGFGTKQEARAAAERNVHESVKTNIEHYEYEV